MAQSRVYTNKDLFKYPSKPEPEDDFEPIQETPEPEDDFEPADPSSLPSITSSNRVRIPAASDYATGFMRSALESAGNLNENIGEYVRRGIYGVPKGIAALFNSIELLKPEHLGQTISDTASTIAHPIETAKSIPPALERIGQFAAQDPKEFAGVMGEMTLSPLLGEIAIPPFVRGTGRVIEGAGRIGREHAPLSNFAPSWARGSTAPRFESWVGGKIEDLGVGIQNLFPRTIQGQVVDEYPPPRPASNVMDAEFSEVVPEQAPPIIPRQLPPSSLDTPVVNQALPEGPIQPQIGPAKTIFAPASTDPAIIRQSEGLINAARPDYPIRPSGASILNYRTGQMEPNIPSVAQPPVNLEQPITPSPVPTPDIGQQMSQIDRNSDFFTRNQNAAPVQKPSNIQSVIKQIPYTGNAEFDNLAGMVKMLSAEYYKKGLSSDMFKTYEALTKELRQHPAMLQKLNEAWKQFEPTPPTTSPTSPTGKGTDKLSGLDVQEIERPKIGEMGRITAFPSNAKNLYELTQELKNFTQRNNVNEQAIEAFYRRGEEIINATPKSNQLITDVNELTSLLDKTKNVDEAEALQFLIDIAKDKFRQLKAIENEGYGKPVKISDLKRDPNYEPDISEARTRKFNIKDALSTREMDDPIAVTINEAKHLGLNPDDYSNLGELQWAVTRRTAQETVRTGKNPLTDPDYKPEGRPDYEHRSLDTPLKLGDISEAAVGENQARMDIGDRRAMIQMFKKTYKGSVPQTAAKELIQNAIDATAPLGENARLSVDLDELNKIITVTDNGPGLTKSMIQNEYTDLTSSGKRGGAQKTIGEMGVGKTTYLTTGENVKITTIAKEADGRVMEYTFGGTPEDIIEGFTINERQMPPNTPTGTKIEFQAPKDQGGTMALKSYIRNLAEHSGSPVPFKFNVKHRDQVIGTTDVGMKTSVDITPMAEGASEGTNFKIGIPLNANLVETDKISLILNNRGMFQGVDTLHLSQKVTTPDRLVIDLDPKVPATHDFYPLTAPTRESLTWEIKNKIDDIVHKELVEGEIAKKRKELGRIFDSLAPKKGQAYTIVDRHGKYTPEELALFADNPALIKLAKQSRQALNEMAKKFIHRSLGEIKSFGFVLDDVTRGINVRNPINEKEFSIMLNPHTILQSADNAEEFADAYVHVLMHEFTHVMVREEGKDFTSAFADVGTKFGNKLQSKLYRSVYNAISDSFSQSGYNAEIQKLFDVFENAQGREALGENTLIDEAGSKLPESKGQGGTNFGDKPNGEGTIKPKIKIKKDSDFDYNGEYNVEFPNGEKTKIFYDRQSQTWYETGDRADKDVGPWNPHHSKDWAFNKNELLEKLRIKYEIKGE